MQQQERDLISGLFDRLKPFESQPRDGEAEQFIWDRASKQPASAYLLVQTVLVQEQALKAAQERIAELEAKAAAAPQPGAGFLGNAPRIGPWGAAVASPASPTTSAPSSVPSTRSPLQAAVSPPAQQQPAAGGGFLRTAMMTAAGVAGGALLFEGIRGLMSSNPGPFGQQAAMGGAGNGTGTTPPELLPPDSTSQQQAYADDQSGQQEDYDTASFDDGSGGAGDDDSWA